MCICEISDICKYFHSLFERKHCYMEVCALVCPHETSPCSSAVLTGASNLPTSTCVQIVFQGLWYPLSFLGGLVGNYVISDVLKQILAGCSHL